MNELTRFQESFIIDSFFKNEQYAGWKNIANSLLQTGSCIVPGSSCIWCGGIGNFIKTTEAKNAIDCLLYEFDLDYFMSSEWFKEILDQYLGIVEIKMNGVKYEYEQLSCLKNNSKSKDCKIGFESKIQQITAFFEPFFENLETATSGRYPNSVFYKKNGKVIFEHCQNEEFNFFYVDYGTIWSVFEDKFGLKYQEISDFIKGMVEKHLNLRGVTPEKVPHFKEIMVES